MSIYPVKISDWYVKGNPFGKEIPMLKSILDSGYFNCLRCKKPVPWDRGYVMHSITFGGPSECWCSVECLEVEG